MKKYLPKSPLAAAGVGALIGAGIAGYTMWDRYKEGEVTRKEAVACVVKQSLLFGGVVATSTLAGGQRGGGIGLAAMSVVGLGGGMGGGRGGGAMLPGMISQALGSGGGGGGGRGGRGGRGSGQSSGILDSISDSVAELFVSKSRSKFEEGVDESAESSEINEVEETGGPEKI